MSANLILIFGMVAAAAGIAALAVPRLIQRAVSEAMAASRVKDDAKDIRAGKLGFTFVIRSDGGRLHVIQQIENDYEQLSSEQVEQWLDQRNLMMMPKALDFSVRKEKEL